MRIVLLVLLSAGLLPVRLYGSQGWEMEVRQSVQTAKGLLELKEVGRSGFRIYVNGILIRELEGFDLVIWGTLPSVEAPQYVLLGIDTANGFCPYKYFLLDVTAIPVPYLTQEFADCSPVPKVEMQGQSVKMNFPPSHDVKAQQWLYNPARRAVAQIR